MEDYVGGIAQERFVMVLTRQLTAYLAYHNRQPAPSIIFRGLNFSSA
jgi:hypothetical protein